MSKIWPLPKVTFSSLNLIEEKRPVALLTSDDAWQSVGHLLNLPLVVQAEPVQEDQELMHYLAQNLPSQAEVVYVVGTGAPLVAGKMVANANKVPLVVVPTAIDSDALFESFVTFMKDGLLTRVETGAPSELIIDWALIEAAPAHQRAGAIADLLAIVTALLDWRYAGQQNRTTPDERFSAWGASVAAGLGSQAIKSAKAIGEGQVEALRTLIDLVMMSVQLAHQLGHDRHQEGTEHYFAYALQNNGVHNFHAEMVGPGILFTAALHRQDPTALREALTQAGIRLDQLRNADVQLAINDLASFCATNNLPYGIAHDLDTSSDQVKSALEKAGYHYEAAAEVDWATVVSPATSVVQEVVENVVDAVEEVADATLASTTGDTSPSSSGATVSNPATTENAETPSADSDTSPA